MLVGCHACPLQHNLQKILQQHISQQQQNVAGKALCVIFVRYTSSDAVTNIKMGEAWRVVLNEELLQQLKHFCGENNVSVIYKQEVEATW